jgi:TonB family protein
VQVTCSVSYESPSRLGVCRSQAQKTLTKSQVEGFGYDTPMLGTARTGTALVFAILLTNVASAQNSVPTPPADDVKQLTASAPASIFSMPADPAAILDVASRVNGLSGDKISPWHIKATYQKFNPSGKLLSPGIYEEFWFSDKSYKRAFTSATFAQTDYATERGIYRSGSQDWPGRSETEVRMYLTAPIPATLDLHHFQLKMESLSVGTGHLQCVTLISNKDKVYPDRSSYCFEQSRPMLRLAVSPEGLTQNLYDGVVEFQRHFVARDIRVTYRNQPVLIIHVDEIGGLSESGRAEVTPSPDATALLTGHIVVPEGTMSPLVSAFPVYPDNAKRMHVEGAVIIRIILGKDGVVTSADAISGPDELRKAAVDAVRKWVFRPFLVLGDPTEVETSVKIIFQMGGPD